MRTAAGGRTATGKLPGASVRGTQGPVGHRGESDQSSGKDGWELVEVVSQAHSVYWLSFELAYVMEDEAYERPVVNGVTTPY